MSDRRHELEDNALAVQLNKLNEIIEPYSKLILAALIAVVIGGAAWSFMANEQLAVRSDATLELIQAGGATDAEVFSKVINGYPETRAAQWARLYQGNEYLAQGIESLYNDRESAEQILEDARQSIKSALAGSTDSLLQSRAHLSLARIDESLGDFDAAIEHYKQIIAIAESPSMSEFAQSRTNRLADAKTVEFIEWFNSQDFSPPEPALPPSLPSGDDLPGLPDLELPDLTTDMLETSSDEGEAAEATEDGDAEEAAAETSGTADAEPPAETSGDKEAQAAQSPAESGTEETATEEP